MAREVNLISFHGPPFAYVLPVARDLGTARGTTDRALHLFSEPARPEVPLDRLFDLTATRRCSTVPVANGLTELVSRLRTRPVPSGSLSDGELAFGLPNNPLRASSKIASGPAGQANSHLRIRTHAVVAHRDYLGPLLSYDSPQATLQAAVEFANATRAGKDVLGALVKRFRAFERTAELLHASHGAQLVIERLTLLPDVHKNQESGTGPPGAEHRCGPHAEMKSPASVPSSGWCGQEFLRHLQTWEAADTLVVFITDSSAQARGTPLTQLAAPCHSRPRPCGPSASLLYRTYRLTLYTYTLWCAQISRQDDYPVHRAIREYWSPRHGLSEPRAWKAHSDRGHAAHIGRMMDDERLITRCFPLAPRFDQAVAKLLSSAGERCRT